MENSGGRGYPRTIRLKTILSYPGMEVKECFVWCFGISVWVELSPPHKLYFAILKPQSIWRGTRTLWIKSHTSTFGCASSSRSSHSWYFGIWLGFYRLHSRGFNQQMLHLVSSATESVCISLWYKIKGQPANQCASPIADRLCEQCTIYCIYCAHCAVCILCILCILCVMYTVCIDKKI